jgi:hypothetical protein
MAPAQRTTRDAGAAPASASSQTVIAALAAGVVLFSRRTNCAASRV